MELYRVPHISLLIILSRPADFLNWIGITALGQPQIYVDLPLRNIITSPRTDQVKRRPERLDCARLGSMLVCRYKLRGYLVVTSSSHQTANTPTTYYHYTSRASNGGSRRGKVAIFRHSKSITTGHFSPLGWEAVVRHH